MADGRILEARRQVDDFLLSALKGNTNKRYLIAASAFLDDLAAGGMTVSAMSEEDLDYALAEHIVECFHEFNGAEGIGHAGLLLAAMSKLKPRHKYRVAWRALDVWRQRAPPNQAPAFPQDLAMAVVSWLTMAWARRRLFRAWCVAAHGRHKTWCRAASSS